MAAQGQGSEHCLQPTPNPSEAAAHWLRTESGVGKAALPSGGCQVKSRNCQRSGLKDHTQFRSGAGFLMENSLQLNSREKNNPTNNGQQAQEKMLNVISN